MYSEGRDEFWCCYRRVRCLYKCWLEPKRPTYHISVVSGVLGKAAMKVREETKAPHTSSARALVRSFIDFEEGRPSRAGRPVCVRIMRRAVYGPSMHCYLEIVRRTCTALHNDILRENIWSSL